MRSTAIVLNTLVKAGATEAPIRPMVRWLMGARKNGRWGNTQENALRHAGARQLLPEVRAGRPDFRAVVTFGERELAAGEFKGRSTSAARTRRADGPDRRGVWRRRLTAAHLHKRGHRDAVLHRAASLRSRSDVPRALDSGFRIERRYEPFVEEGQKPRGDWISRPATSCA